MKKDISDFVHHLDEVGCSEDLLYAFTLLLEISDNTELCLLLDTLSSYFLRKTYLTLEDLLDSYQDQNLSPKQVLTYIRNISNVLNQSIEFHSKANKHLMSLKQSLEQEFDQLPFSKGHR